MVTKLVQKKEILINKQHVFEANYIDSVDKCNSYKTHLYEKEMPTLVQTSIALMQQFYRQFKKVLAKIVMGYEELSPVVAKEANLLRIYVIFSSPFYILSSVSAIIVNHSKNRELRKGQYVPVDKPITVWHWEVSTIPFLLLALSVADALL
jgi:hypothetical protein